MAIIATIIVLLQCFQFIFGSYIKDKIQIRYIMYQQFIILIHFQSDFSNQQT